MSQLIEDLEVVNKEKESLLHEKLIAERKCKEYNDLVERQSMVSEIKKSKYYPHLYSKVLDIFVLYLNRNLRRQKRHFKAD